MHIKSLEHLPVQHSHFVWLVWNYSCWANIHHSLVWHYFWNTSNRFLGKFSLISARILLLLIWHQILSSICQVWFDFSFPFYLSIFFFFSHFHFIVLTSTALLFPSSVWGQALLRWWRSPPLQLAACLGTSGEGEPSRDFNHSCSFIGKIGLSLKWMVYLQWKTISFMDAL